MNNWYKASKMIDFSEEKDIMSPSYCPRCRRWATQNPSGEMEWKPYFQMSALEKAEMDRYQKGFHEGTSRTKPFICPECKGEA